MEIRYATISKTGRRHNNEDAYKVIDMPQNNQFMGIVCDGMGGHSFGETASETSVMAWVVIPLERLPVKRYAILYLTFGRNTLIRQIATQR